MVWTLLLTMIYFTGGEEQVVEISAMSHYFNDIGWYLTTVKGIVRITCIILYTKQKPVHISREKKASSKFLPFELVFAPLERRDCAHPWKYSTL